MSRNFPRNTARTKRVKTEHDILQSYREKTFGNSISTGTWENRKGEIQSIDIVRYRGASSIADIAARLNVQRDANTDSEEFYGS